jgi:TolB protein
MRRRTTIATAGCVLACAAPAGAATNGRIAFTSFRDGGQARIHTMAPDGSDQRAISFGPGSDAQAEFSPDGGAIAFRRGTTGDYEVWAMGAGGESPRPLTDTPAGSNSTQPSWLPDGQGLLFRRGPNGGTDVWRMAADGSAQAPLVTAPGDQWYPSASPATGRILFATTVTGSDREIQDAAPDGGGVRTLRDVPGVYDSAPAYSPDGRRIAFESDADGDMEIYVMDADGGGVLQLTHNGEHDEGPSWSPDGTRLAFTRGPDDADGDIWTMAADGGDQRRLTIAPGRDESPDWQPLPDPAAPAGDTAAGDPAAATPATPAPSGAIGVAPATASHAVLRLAGRRPRLRTALRRGLRLRVTLPASARVALGATLRPAAARRHRLPRRIARRAATLPAGTTVVRLRPSRRAAARLRGARRVRLRIALASPHGAGSLTLSLRR